MSDLFVPALQSKPPNAWGATISESTDGLSPQLTLAVSTGGYLPPERYALGDLLGTGARGRVFMARDRQLDRELAIKFLAHEHARDGRKLAAFIREARVTSRLEHSGVVPVHELDFTARGEPFFTMRPARGQTLGEAIRCAGDGTPPPEIAGLAERLTVFLRVCDAVAYAHAQGVIHRDLKPDNIVLGRFGEVLVLDWGTALVEGEPSATGILVGTPAYMAPEQARCESVDVRSDVYALGATLFHLLTLRHPLWIDDPERFWAAKRTGVYQPCTAAERQHLPEPVIAIIEKALAVRPEERFPSIIALQDAVRAWQANAESMRLVTHGHAQLAVAVDSEGYEHFIGAITAFRAALGLRPASSEAREGLAAALRAQARQALRLGDHGLCQVLAQEAGDSTLAGLARGRRLRVRLTRFVAGLLAVLVTLLVGWVIVDLWQREATWELLLDRDLHAADGLAGMELSGEQVHQTLELPVPDPTRGMVFPRQQTLWLVPVQVRGDVRIEVDLTWENDIDACEIFFNSHREQPPSWWMAPAGFSCQFGGWGGRSTYLSTNPEPAQPDSTESMGLRFETKRPYSLRVERRDGRLSMAVDGREVLARAEPLPLAGTGFDQIAIRMWTTTLVHRIRVWRRSLPAQASPLIAGDALVGEGRFESAARVYQEIAADRPALAPQALSRACLALAQLGEETYRQRQELRTRLMALRPPPEVIDAVWEVEARLAWAAGRHDEALDDLDRIADPASRTPLRLVASGRKSVPPAAVERLLRRIAKVPAVTRLDLSGFPVRDLNPLRAMPLEALVLSDTPVTDLSPLRGMPLNEVVANRTAVADLTPLRGMMLKRLELAETLVEDLSPVAGMPLRNVVLTMSQVRDLTPLRGTRLEALDIVDTGVDDLEPLRGMPLRFLHADNTRVDDLRPLAGAPMHDLSVIATAITDLSPLVRMPLAMLAISDTRISDLTPLQGMQLSQLWMNRTLVSSLETLRGMPLKRLELSGSPVRDLAPLAGMRLQILDIEETGVSDLGPLTPAASGRIRAAGSPITRLGDLLAHPTLELALDGPASGQLIAAWPGPRSLATRILCAVAQRDLPTLRGLAYAHRYLCIPRRLTWEAAQQLATDVGAHLVSIADEAEQRVVENTMVGQNLAWIGLKIHGAELPRWTTGEPLQWDGRVPAAQRHPVGEYYLQPSMDAGRWRVVRTLERNPAVIEWEAP